MTENDIETYTSLPLKPCRRAGCPELVRGGGYCDKHQRTVRRMRRDTQGERGVSGEWHGLYYTARWREMRAEQLIMEPYCRDCAAHGVRSAATDVDHIVPHRGDRKLFMIKRICNRFVIRVTRAKRLLSSPSRTPRRPKKLYTNTTPTAPPLVCAKNPCLNFFEMWRKADLLHNYHTSVCAM